MSNQVPVPPSTQYTIVFPMNIWAKQYDSSFYNPGLTDGRATQEEITNVLREIQEIKKPFNRKIVCALWLYILGLLGVIALMVVGIVGSVGGTDYEYVYTDGYWHYEYVDNDNTGLLVGAIIGGIFGMIFVIFVFACYVAKTSKASRIPVQALFNRINPDFSTRGLRWHMPVHFPRWVELWKDYVSLAPPTGQPTYLPPNMTQQYQNYPGAPTGNPYQMPGTQPQDYQNYGVQPQGYQNYNQPGYNQQNFQNFSANQA